jgi:uncharacterized protein involved in exopolysaccharide biosynthesis
MELRTYFSIMWAYRWPLIIIPLLAALVGLGATYVVSPRFVGETTVQLLPEEIEPRTVTLRSPDGPGTVALGLRDPTELLAQGVVESLSSREVAEYIVDELDLQMGEPETAWEAFKSWVRTLRDDVWNYVRYGYVVRDEDEDVMVFAVQRSLDADLVSSSYHMHIRSRWRDPETATRIANAAVGAVIRQSQRIASESAEEQRIFLDEQRLAARDRVNRARDEVLAYSANNQVVAGQSLAVAVNALEEARTQARQNEIARTLAVRQLDVARQQIEEVAAELVSTTTTNESSSQQAPQTSTITEQSIMPNPVYQSLQESTATLAQDVVRLETLHGQMDNEVDAQAVLQMEEAQRQLAEVERQIAEEDIPRYMRDSLEAQALDLRSQIAVIGSRTDEQAHLRRVEIERDLAAARLELGKAEEQLVGTDATVTNRVTRTSENLATYSSQSNRQQNTTEPNPVYLSIQQDILSLEQRVQSLDQQQDELAAQVRAREQELRDLTASDTQLAALNQELELASNEYSRRTADWYAAIIEESRPVTPLRVVDPATPPNYPSRPIKILWTGIGAAAGLAVAVVLVFVLHTTDLSLHTASEAESALRMPLLAVVPVRRKGVGRPKRRARHRDGHF